MKKLCLLLALLLLLTGCRTRTVADPGRANIVVYTTPEPTATPTPTEPPAASPTPAPTETPEPTVTPEPTPIPVETPAPSDFPPLETPGAQELHPDDPGALEAGGAPLLEKVTVLGVNVTYDPNGGDGGAITTVVELGRPYGLQPQPTRRGHAFGGWWTDPAWGEQVTGDTTVATEVPHTLYAHWSAKATDTVTFDGGGGRVKSREAHRELSPGDRYGSLPTPLREGYLLRGWFTQAEGGEEVTADSLFPGGDQTLYAQWDYDPLEYWKFVLTNKVQQIYLCQQEAIYFETLSQGVTAPYSAILSATGSLNIAENREDPNVTDQWVREKNPAVVVKQVMDFSDAEAQRAALAQRFPDQELILVDSRVLADWNTGIYTCLALAGHLYPDWFTDVDLTQAARELGVTQSPILFF